MSIIIGGVTYFSSVDIQQDLGIVRQTLWRWRKAGTIPQGRRYRGRQVVFTKQEIESIRQYANRLEPVEFGDSDRVKHFSLVSLKKGKQRKA